MAMITVYCPIFTACSVLMSFLFAYSASVQLNDPDWYLWFPLYGLAFGVNFLQTGFPNKGFSNRVASLVLWGGIVLLVKVIAEDYLHGAAGLWSLDMHERLVREKLGSGLVVLSMLLHLKASKEEEREPVARFAESGMVMLVVVSVGLTLYFFTWVQKDIRF